MAVNESWRVFAQANAARSNVMEEANYLRVCETARGRDAEYAQEFASGLKAVLAGERYTFALEYPCHAPHERRWFIARVSQFSDGLDRYAVVAHENITERKLAEEELYRQAKEAALVEERHRISRELHDGVNQSLFSSMSIAQAITRIYENDPDRTVSLLEEVVHLNRAALAEMRILLNELRPYSIINTPLSTLIRQLVTTITHRLEGKVAFSVDGSEIQLPDEVHFGIYRITQEAINNILKHSEAQCVEITLIYGIKQVEVQIKDNGRGFDIQSTPENIGLRSMRERAEEIVVGLDITSVPGKGTDVNIIWKPPIS